MGGASALVFPVALKRGSSLLSSPHFNRWVPWGPRASICLDSGLAGLPSEPLFGDVGRHRSQGQAAGAPLSLPGPAPPQQTLSPYPFRLVLREHPEIVATRGPALLSCEARPPRSVARLTINQEWPRMLEAPM